MHIEVVTIGDELLLGYTIDTNAAHLARVLAAEGVEIARRTTVGDTADAIAGAVREALDRADGVITTGGLGPTSDDLTKPSIAALFGRRVADAGAPRHLDPLAGERPREVRGVGVDREAEQQLVADRDQLDVHAGYRASALAPKKSPP